MGAFVACFARILWIAFGVHFAVFACAVEAEPRLALVIGNSDYRSLPSLDNPARDARLIRETLQELGFEVRLVLNAKDDLMQAAVDDFTDQIMNMQGGTALFFYAGHGVQNRGQNQLLPVNYATDKPRYEVVPVSVEGVVDSLSVNKAVRKFFIFDACRNLESLPGKVIEASINFDLPSNSLLAFSASSGEVAEDGEGKHSIYAFSLARNLKVDGIQASSVFNRTRADVLTRTNDRQTPTDMSTLVGEFSFATGTSKPSAYAYDPIEEDKAAWERAKSSDSRLGYNDYIQRFPRGLHREEAGRRLDELSRRMQPTARVVTSLGIQVTEMKNVEVGESYFVITGVDSNSPLFGQVFAGDTIRQVNYRAFQPEHIADPSTYIEEKYEQTKRLDLTVERNGTPYMVSHH